MRKEASAARKLSVATMSLLENLSDFCLPSWEEITDIELYMDQVIGLVSRYLGAFEKYSDDGRLITASMINNYVKQGVIPPPKNKRYAKEHIATLIIICILKQIFSLSEIKVLLGVGEEKYGSLSDFYNFFRQNQEKAFKKSSAECLKSGVSEEFLFDSVCTATALKGIAAFITEEERKAAEEREKENARLEAAQKALREAEEKARRAAEAEEKARRAAEAKQKAKK